MTETEFLLHLARATMNETKKDKTGETRKKTLSAGGKTMEDALRDKIDIKITFRGGGEIVIPDEQWDDYRYDGKFFTVVKNGADIAMYNAKEVFSLVLINGGK